MAVVLGLHFGHDGAACVLVDGRIASYRLTERVRKIKHAGGVPASIISAALDEAGVRVDDIDLVSVTGTQRREIIFPDPEEFSFAFEANGVSPSVDALFGSVGANITYQTLIRDTAAGDGQGPSRRVEAHWPDYFDGCAHVGYPVMHFRVPRRDTIVTADRDISRLQDMCMFPVAARLFGRPIPGFFVDHHAAHAASVFFKSPFGEALIVTADGGSLGNLGGFVMLGSGDRLLPVETHEFVGGGFYERVSATVGLDPGKLMGLAGHGEAAPTRVNLRGRHARPAVDEFLGSFGDREVAAARADPTGPSGRTIAATAQASFEREFVATVLDTVRRFEPGARPANLCLSGGCALNCPSNSVLAEAFGNDRIFVESSCNDEGLAYGSASWVFTHVLGGQIPPALRAANRSPFKSGEPANVKAATEAAHAAGLAVSEAADGGRAALTEHIARGDIGAIMRGRSEIGPRALGHRSIVARADIRQHHVDINDIKSREQWRPLAPMVPAELFDRYFAGPRNPYMLMTCRTTTDRTPAVRHADGSARVQVLDDADDLIRGVTLSMESSGGVGVIVNTSLNGRNEPLYDDAEDAVGLLRRSPKMRFLLLQGTMISKP